MVSRIMLFFMAAMSATSLSAAADSQRFDSELLSTKYFFEIPANALPEYVQTIPVHISVQAKFSLYALMGEPVVFCSATWRLEQLDWTHLEKDIPPEVLQKVELFNLRLELNFLLDSHAVACDAGVPYPNGSTKASFNVPASPEWEQLFHISVAGRTNEASYIKEISQYYSESQAKELLAQLLKDSKPRPFLSVLNASIDVSPIKYYLLEQQQKEYQKIQASLTKHSQSNHEQNDEDIFSQVVEKAFVEKQIRQVSKKITQSRDTSTSTESAATINHEKMQRLQQQCDGFDMPAVSLEQIRLSDDNLSACMTVNYKRFYDEQSGLYGFKDHNGNIRIPAVYKSASNFQGNIAAVEVNDHQGVYNWKAIDRFGRLIIPDGHDFLKYEKHEKYGEIYVGHASNFHSFYDHRDEWGCYDNYQYVVVYDLKGSFIRVLKKEDGHKCADDF